MSLLIDLDSFRSSKAEFDNKDWVLQCKPGMAGAVINLNDQVLFIEDVFYARIVYINNEWYLKEFLMEPKSKNYERI